MTGWPGDNARSRVAERQPVTVPDRLAYPAALCPLAGALPKGKSDVLAEFSLSAQLGLTLVSRHVLLTTNEVNQPCCIH